MKARNIVLGAVLIAGVVAAVAAWPLVQARRAGAAGEAVQTGQVVSVEAVTSVEASGTVSPVQSATLAWKTTGTVATVDVAVGDMVRAGDRLMSLDPTSVPANIIQAQSELIEAQAALEALLNPTALSLANAQQAVVDAQQQLEDAQRALRSTANPNITYYQDQVAAKQQALLQAQQNVEKTNIGDLANALKRAQDELENKTNQLNDARTAQEQCPGCTVVFINATGRRMSLEDAEAEYEAALNAHRVAELNYQQALANNSDAVEAAQEALADAEANLAAALAGPAALDLAQKEAAVAVAEARLAQAQEDLATLQNGADPDDIRAAEVRVLAAQATADSLVLRAPFDGEVLAVYARPGDPASQTTTAVMLANRSQLHVDVQIDEADVSQVSLGDPVTVTVDAIPGLALRGEVASIAPFGESVQGLVRYTVRVNLLETDPRLYLNMTANVQIVTDVQPNALAVPLDAIHFDEQGEYVLRVDAGGAQSRVDVVSGVAAGDDLIVVTGDLRPGDVVVLNVPDVPQGLPFGPGG